MAGKAMGSHQCASTGTDVWLTPRHILDALGPFDLDPCAAPVEANWKTARVHYRLPDDGLTKPWLGRVWCNPPYSNVWRWLDKLAFHGSGVPGGHACGSVIDFYGSKLYFAGDTALFSDMQLLPKLDAFEYAVLPIGGNFTMDPNDALIACKLLQAKYVIPVHYNTWPPIAQDVEAFKAAVEDETDSKVLIVKPGNTIDID